MESTLLRFAAASLAAAWALLAVIAVSGHLVWDNRLLWLPLIMFGVSFFCAVGSHEYEEQRAPLVIVAILAFGSMLVYTVGYVFLFALVGH
jgi:hypothetical protein